MIAESVLLSVSGSSSSPLTVAMLVMSPNIPGKTIMVLEAIAPTAKVPKLHVMVPPSSSQLASGAAETKSMPGGSLSVSEVFVDATSPRFMMLNV